MVQAKWRRSGQSLAKSHRSLRRAIRRRRAGGTEGMTPMTLEALEPRVLFHAGHDHVEPFIEPVFEDNDVVIVANATNTPTAALNLSDTFTLHSNPGAKHTIYLDFDGHVTENTQWNSWAGVNQIHTPAYDFDGNVFAFSDAELSRIQYIFQRVAEDFSPFDVDVTTEAPPVGDLIKSGSSDTRWGVRVAIGGSSNDWLGQSAGGVAWVGSFNWSSDTAVFVFEAQLGNGNEKYVAEAVGHEVGHALGLNHDGASGQEYFPGYGSGQTGWAPIMGSSYSKNLSQWSKGEYAGANNTEDDLHIITTNNGFGYRADDHSNSLGSATALTVTGSSVSGSGIIERNTDFDLFSFTADAGTLSLDINPFERGPNLDIRAQLLDSNGNVIATSNPVDLLSAGIDTTVSGGTYYLRITGTGKGDPANGGYSDYGSLGQYTITGQLVEPSPTLSVDDVAVNEADGTALFTVRLSSASSGVVTVNAATANGTTTPDSEPATAGSDYWALSQTLTFNPGELTKTVSVSIINDAIDESNENFLLRLSNVTGDATIADNQGVATIIDNDTPVSVTVNNVTVNEADGTASFTVRLSEASSDVVTVNAATANGTTTPDSEPATAGSDYWALSRTLTFNPGELTKTVSVSIINDAIDESNENFLLRLSNVTGNAVIADNHQGVATIVDNDTVVEVSVNDVSGNEGNPRKGRNPEPKSTDFNFTINLSQASTQSVTVQYGTANGTAIAGDDYTAKSGSVTFNPGETSKTVTVTVVGDGIVESDENFFLNLLSASNAMISDGQAEGTILNDDSSGGGGKGGGKGNGKPKKGFLIAASDAGLSGLFSAAYSTSRQDGPSSWPSFGFNLREVIDSSDAA